MTEKLTSAELQAAAKARAIALLPAQLQPALAGANWLRDCVALLRKAGFK